MRLEIDAIRSKVKALGIDAVIEKDDTILAARILLRLLDEEPVTATQIRFLKAQSVDITKILALIGLQAVPGSSVALMVLQQIAERHGFSLLPSVIKDPNLTDGNSEEDTHSMDNAG